MINTDLNGGHFVVSRKKALDMMAIMPYEPPGWVARFFSPNQFTSDVGLRIYFYFSKIQLNNTEIRRRECRPMVGFEPTIYS
jgi:hypothetical protein